MQLNDLEQLYLHRQSCRAFSDQPVSDETLTEICRLALLSPSACNAQPWKLIAVNGEKAKEIAPCLQSMGMNKFTSDAKAFIVVAEGESNLTAKIGSRLKKSEFTPNDIGMLTAHLILAADVVGLGTCIIGWRDEKKICNVLSLPEDTHIPHVIAVGYPKEGDPIRAKNRKATENVFSLITD